MKGNFNLLLNQDELDLGQFSILSSSEDLGALVLKSLKRLNPSRPLGSKHSESGSFNKKLHRIHVMGRLSRRDV